MTTPANPPPEDTLVQTKSPKKVQQMFNDISATYDIMNHALSLNIDKRWRRFVAQKVMRPQTRKALDVCGGTGDLALALHQQAQKTGITPLIVCSDFTDGMMRIGNEKFRKIKATATDSTTTDSTATDSAAAPVPLLADTMRLPFTNNVFDAVTVAFGIRNVADPAAGLREMARVCAPGGIIAVLEFSETRHSLIGTGFSIYFRHILPTIGRLVTGTRAYSYLQKSVEKFPEGKTFAAMLTKATGSPTSMHRLSFGIATLYISEKSAFSAQIQSQSNTRGQSDKR